jgi:phosphoribosylformylglycinamidine synthase
MPAGAAHPAAREVTPHDVRKVVSMDAKKSGNVLYVVGMTYNELGGSHYYALENQTGNHPPIVRPEQGRATFEALSRAIAGKIVRACHDCSEGGLAVALAEMAFAGEIGARVRLADVPASPDVARDDDLLFSESPARYLLEVARDRLDALKQVLGPDVPWAPIGETIPPSRLEIVDRAGRVCVNEALADLKEAWQAPLRW